MEDNGGHDKIAPKVYYGKIDLEVDFTLEYQHSEKTEHKAIEEVDLRKSKKRSKQNSLF